MSSAIDHPLQIHRITLTLAKTVSSPERQQWQHRLDRALSRVSWRPTIPPQAILVVRSLPDPRPGSLLAENVWRGVRAWEQATQAALNDCWRTAARPAQAAVPPTANSVWFADPAEWLACLSRDVYRGVASDRWWWQTALRSPAHLGKIDRLVQLWQTSAPWLPATLTGLLHHDQIALRGILGELPPDQAGQLLAQVAQVYGCVLPTMEPPQTTCAFLVAALAPHLPLSVGVWLEALAPETQALVAVCFTLPNTAQWLDAATAQISLTPGQAPATGAIAHRPSPPRIVAIQSTPLADVGDLDEPTTPLPTQSTPLADMGDLDEPMTPLPHQRATFPEASDQPLASPSGVSGHPLAPAPDPFLGDKQNRQIPDTPLPQPETEPSERSTASPYPPPGGFTPTQAAPVVPAGDVPPLARDRNRDRQRAAEQGIATTLGGLWYLVNVLVALGWPGRTTTLTPWHQLLALAQALLPTAPPDPVWGLLADLAGEPAPVEAVLQWQQGTLVQVRSFLAARLEFPEAIAPYLTEPATLYLTRTHVDVVFSLEQIRLDLRMAGLDQDPGWVPELAHVIAFHYE